MLRSPMRRAPAAALSAPASPRRLPPFTARGLTAALAAALALAALPAAVRAQEPGQSDPRLRARTSAIERELVEDNPSRAFRAARQGIDDLLTSGPVGVDHSAVARLLEYLSIAAAGRSLPDTAAWNWSLAQSFDPSLTGEDLSRWGEEGAFLAARPLRPPAQDGDVVPEADEPRREPLNLFSAPAGVETRLPDEENVPPPPYPPALRGSGIEGTVLLQVRIDRRGRTNDPLILESPHPLLALAAAEQVADWRYRPAEVAGDKVGVYYSVRIDFRAE